MNKWQKLMDEAFKKLEAIRKKAEAENRALTAEEIEERAKLRGEIDQAKREWDDFKAEEETRASLYGTGTGSLTVPRDPTIEMPDQPIYRGSPATMLGQQLLDVRALSMPGTEAKERQEARSRLEQNERRTRERRESILRKADRESRAAATGGHTIAVPSDGGFFLQGETAVDLMTNGFNNSEVLSRCSSRTLGAGTQFVDIIGIDETSRANGSRGGGIRVYTTAELADFTASKTKFSKIRIEPTKLTGLYYASGEMIRNVTFLGQEMRQLFGEEFAFKCQDLVVRGTGAGEALGILNAPCLVTQAKETNQTADTIVTMNVLKMESRLVEEKPSVVYLVNRETKPQLATLNQAVGTGGVLVPLYKTDFYQGKRMATLNGFFCITIEQASAIGDVGDIILADLSQYITANKGDIMEAMSIHVEFIYDQETYRFIYYFDGQPRWSSALTPYKGAATVGPFITLAAR
ncbi:MAG: phage major capsid protein [Pseudomonadota bacterium]